MPTIQFSTSHHERRTGLLRLPCKNVWWDDKVGAFFDRPAIVDYETKGSGQIRGMFYQAGLFNSDRFYISGAQVFRESAIIATLAGEDNARIAGGFDGANDCLVWVANGGLVYKYTGGVVSSVAIPDDTLIYDVKFFDNRWLYFGNLGRFYWSEINEPSNISGLSFATAEAKPDGFLAAAISGKSLYIFGSDTIELWYTTGDSTIPFKPNPESTLDTGAFSRDSVYERAGRIYFLSKDRQLFLLAGGLTPIADDSVLESLQYAPLENISLCSLFIDGKEFFILTDKDTASYVFDGANWYRWNRYQNLSLSIVGTIVKDGVTYAGDMSSGSVYRFDSTVNADTEAHIDRIVSGYYPLSSGKARNSSAVLMSSRAPGGLTTVVDPQVEMRYSDDGGYEFSEWMAESMGGIGEYWVKPTWRALGQRSAFGRVYQVRCAENVPFCPQNLVLDEDTR